MNVLDDINLFVSRYRDDLTRSRLETITCDDGAFDIQLLEVKPHEKMPKQRFTF